MALDERVVVAPSRPEDGPLATPATPPAGGPDLVLAACRGMDPWLFYSSDPQDVSRARMVCSMCSVRDACLQTALASDRPGVLGGFTERERVRLAMMTQSAPLSVTAQR